jgi:hypothetical protein
MSESVVAQLDALLQRLEVLRALERDAEIERLRAGLQRIVEGDGFWDAPSLARDLLEGKDVT